MFRPLNLQSQAQFCGVGTWMDDQIRIPHVVITCFSFFPFLFQGDIEESRTATGGGGELLYAKIEKYSSSQVQIKNSGFT